MFFLVDAFTKKPFCGNPAGVCIVESYPRDEELQKIARYYDWSEIAFLKRLGESAFQIRWFSPIDEAPLCGHATLASAHVIFENELVPAQTASFQYSGGTLFVETNNNLIKMNFPAKQVQKCHCIPFSVEKIFHIRDYVEIVKDDLLYIVVLNSPKDVINATPDFEMIKKLDCRAIAITARYIDSGNFDFCSRYFAPKVGIYEDPVCGSAHCRLACYWASMLRKNTFTACQASKRSGILYLEIEDDIVKICGNAVTVCQLFNYMDTPLHC
ncbi:MAG: PhzF family phenazine biosynthesis protein [Holosporales bacterium]|jgi:PhzF family phenazine biosynthesis protein|nr:PhzF family phenazine biosynthesis protein [Holosporales bacterium]